MESIINFIENISQKWEKPKGLIIALIIFVILYFTIFVDRLNDFYKFSVWLRYIIIPLVFTAIVLFVWLYTTNRINWLKRKKITVGVFIKVDDESSENKIKKIVNQTIKDINHNFEDIHLRLYPINHIESKNQLTKYYTKKIHVLDAIILANVESGKEKNESNFIEDILIIKEITFQGNFNINENLAVFKTNINLAEELTLRNINKNWAFIESNSLNDKAKIKYNLYDIILFYCGLYLIYKNNFISSLKILKTLHNKEDSSAKIDNKNKKILVTKNFFQAARLNDILLNLYADAASKAYLKDDNKEEAYNLLKECQTLFGNHPQSFEHNIALARLAYEKNNNIEEAKHFSNQAAKFRPNSTLIYINNGFFALVENNLSEVYKNYKELAHSYRHKNYINYIDTVHFLEREKNKYKSRAIFEFAIGLISLLYGDKKLGKTILQQFIDSELKNNSNYSNLISLSRQLLTRGGIKSTYHKRNIKNKKKRRRK